MLEPQGTAFLVLLVLAFAGLVTWLALTKQVVVRVLAAFLAFLPAAVFGIAVVNKYYDYYQGWGALYSDLSGSGTQSVPQLASPVGKTSGGSFGAAVTASADTALSAQTGYLFRTTVTGHTSHLSRTVFVYLPPQYFQKRFRHYKFPVIELLHGSPGGPRAWVDVMSVIPTFLSLLGTHPDDAAVLVMPDTDGSPRYGLQCLNNPGGIQDMTFVARDVPDAIARIVRVQPPGRAWGVAGYSEGGYCAANIGLQVPKGYGAVGVLSGYFAPIKSQVPAGNKPSGRPLTVNVFLGHPGLRLINTPRYYVTRVPVNDELPVFWLAVGAADAEDVGAAQYFRQVLQTRMVNVPLMVVPGGGHQASVWRAALGPMLSWMTPQLTGVVKQADAAAARKAHDAKPRRPHAATASGKP